MEEKRHILLLALPIQGAINPSLKFANHLSRLGATVTLLTDVYGHSLISRSSPTRHLQGAINLVSFSDGYDDGVNWKSIEDSLRFRSQFEAHGSKALREIATASAHEGRPITCVVYTMLHCWAAKVARELHLPSVLLWTQAFSVFVVYYNYFNGYGNEISEIIGDPSRQITLPGLPRLAGCDFSSFLFVSDQSMQSVILSILKQQLDAVEAEAKPIILINTFNELEEEALRAIQKLDLIPIGPLVASALLERKDGPLDPVEKPKDDVKCWLDTKPQSSVVYVSFGSLAELSKQQMEEIASGLLESHRPFLWVIRNVEKWEREEDKLNCIDELQRQGMIVPWCSQVEVLSHPCLGCFVTHCGWNSSLESLVSGVPMVGFPHNQDQFTNAKLIEDVFHCGIRVKPSEGGMAEGEEIKRCIEVVMGGGEKGEEMRRNAEKLKKFSREAAKEGGTSDKNLQYFLSTF